MTHTAKDPLFHAKVRDTARRQKVMGALGASLEALAPGEAEIRLPLRRDLTREDGTLGTGVIATLLDSACGFAALSLAPPGGAVLAVEFKVNLHFPAAGETFIARGAVERAGGALSTCVGQGFSVESGEEKLVATMLSTIMTVVKPERERGGGASREAANLTEDKRFGRS